MKLSDQQILFLAQGFGVGRIRRAPGTWGSLVGFGYFLLLVASNQTWLLLLGPFVAVAAAGLVSSWRRLDFLAGSGGWDRG